MLPMPMQSSRSNADSVPSTSDLILRSRASARRLEGWPLAQSCLLPSFETRASFDKLRSALLRMRAELIHTRFPRAMTAFEAAILNRSIPDTHLPLVYAVHGSFGQPFQ